LVQQTFAPEDAELILQIPIYEHTGDFIAWHYYKKGIFSVKSAYRVAVDKKARESSSGLTSSSYAEEGRMSCTWKKIWRLPLPNKVLHFLWRVANYSLPLRMKLQRRGMVLDTRCPLCYRMDEDGGHCFLKCKKVKGLWSLAQLDHIRLKLLSCPDALSFCEEILKLNEEVCLRVILLLWIWWQQRNRANRGEVIRGYYDICSSINFHFLNCMKDKQKPKEMSCVKAQRWSPPPDGILKINTDGSFRKTSHTGGWGFTIRNTEGNLIAAGAGNLEYVSDALHAEAQAMLHAAIIASQMGCLLKQAVTTDAYNLSSLASMFREIKFHLRVGFNDVKVVFCPRACNGAAHSLAAHGVTMEVGHYETWLGQFPEFVKDVVAGDVSSMLS
jgi:hypothetical protein